MTAVAVCRLLGLAFLALTNLLEWLCSMIVVPLMCSLPFLPVWLSVNRMNVAKLVLIESRDRRSLIYLIGGA